METSEVLNKAADLIEERGWVTGSYDLAQSGICLESAISVADSGVAGRDAWLIANRCAAGSAVRTFLELGEWDGWTQSLWMWNDNQSTGQRVIEVLRACAVIEAAHEEQAAAEATYAENLAAVSA